jgi:triacylglycerol lipase
MLYLCRTICRHANRSPALLQASRALSTRARLSKDPRIDDIGRVIEDEYATIRDNYGNPIPFILEELETNF